MDLARRVLKIVTDNRGTLLFGKTEKPATGYVTVQKVSSYPMAALTAQETRNIVRQFLFENLFLDDGVSVFRRSGRLNMARIKYFPTIEEAEASARFLNISHIVNLADVANPIQVGDFTPDVPGDGAVE